MCGVRLGWVGLGHTPVINLILLLPLNVTFLSHKPTDRTVAQPISSHKTLLPVL